MSLYIFYPSSSPSEATVSYERVTLDTALVAVRVVVAAYLYDALPKYEGLNAYLAHSTYPELPERYSRLMSKISVGEGTGEGNEETKSEEEEEHGGEDSSEGGYSGEEENLGEDENSDGDEDIVEAEGFSRELKGCLCNPDTPMLSDEEVFEIHKRHSDFDFFCKSRLDNMQKDTFALRLMF